MAECLPEIEIEVGPRPLDTPGGVCADCLAPVVMNEWNIQSRAHVCETCGKGFADKEIYHTVLLDRVGELNRSDLCQNCWEQGQKDALRSRSDFLSYWQGVYEAPPPPDAEPIQKETAESLLRKLVDLNDPRYIPAGYILAVMLERKRLLKVKEQLIRDGQRVFIYEHPRSGDVFSIVDPELQLDQLEAVQRDVAHLLEHGLTPPVSDAPSADPTAESPADGEIEAPDGMTSEARSAG